MNLDLIGRRTAPWYRRYEQTPSAKQLLDDIAAERPFFSVNDDITRAAYPERHDRAALDARRLSFLSPGEAAALPAERNEPESGAAALAAVLGALKQAGGRAALAVPLHSSDEPGLAVVRLVVPPLRDVV